VNTEGANETDVREEIAVPLLSALGYKRGTLNDIAREMPLTYARHFLGRKKSADPPLRGRADYILTVTGAGRWVLETKPPHEAIDINAVEQAMSYARHPEVSAAYSVILNGNRVVVYHASQKSSDEPMVDLVVTDPLELAGRLSGLLSPAAIRRDCSPPLIDLGLPLAEGLRSHAHIRGGEIRHEAFAWTSSLELPDDQVASLNELSRRMKGFRIAATGGQIERDGNSRIRANLKWAMPHDDMMKFALSQRLTDLEYVALDTKISSDIDQPTVFDVVGQVSIKEGDTLFDLVSWTTQSAGVSMKMIFLAQAVGFISNMEFCGVSAARYLCTFPDVLDLTIEMGVVSTFQIGIDDR
jgi:hypothetical protein